MACTQPTRGVIRLSTQDGSYIVPPSRALWVPADVPHSITLIEDAELRTVYVHSWLAPPWERCEVLEISPLMRALMLALDTTPDGRPPADAQAPHRERMIAPLLIDIWPRDSRFAKRSFTRLDRAYVDARYSPAYEITGEELAWLVERVTILQETVAAICAEHLTGPAEA